MRRKGEGGFLIVVDRGKNGQSSSEKAIEAETSGPSTGIPALVVSGFLGAGKTSLVRHLLGEAQQTGLRLAVVSNEFGELGIDQALFGKDNSNGYVELEGGCVCCKLSDELLKTLQELWERVRPDQVIVETSGVALPFDTVLNFWREPVSQWVGDCVAVVVVNAEQLADERDLAGTFEQQVSSADLLILNKVDLVESQAFERLEALLGQMAPGTPIIRTVNATVDPEVLFPPDPQGSRKASYRKATKSSPHQHEVFECEEIVVEKGGEPSDLIERIRAMGGLRVKGFVETSEGIRLVQGVGPRIDLVLPPVSPPLDLMGRLVVIRRSSRQNVTH